MGKDYCTHDADSPLPPLLHDLLAVLHGPDLVLRQRRYGGRVTLASMTPVASVTTLRGHLGVEAEHVAELRDLAHPALKPRTPAVSATGTNINSSSIFAKLPPLQLTKTRGSKLASNIGRILQHCNKWLNKQIQKKPYGYSIVMICLMIPGAG